jgi:hypothetical protein
MHRIVDSPELPPGCCALTRTDIGPFIDTLQDFDDMPPFGRIYLARSTVSDLAQQFGFVPPEAHERVIDENTQLKGEVSRLLTELGKVQAVKDLLDSWAPDRTRPPTPTEVAHAGDPEPLEPDKVEAIDAVLFDDEPMLDDTPDGEALPDDLTAVTNLPGRTEAVVAAWYGHVPDDLAGFIEIDPPPDKVDDIKAWIAEPDNEVIAGIRTEIAVAVEKTKKDPRPTVLALDDQEA